ncbi:hydroxyacid dehydrogenase [Peterkaempfera griseoplana]|uniref:hydroxyacid dehydrogenase n=1 Tax=Peterkaempfera griseoplana TaxID=66896 RepID=UPI000D14D383|nr:hydroxyacid dehydrogenase [Peterkaempfera griseoplana]
MSPDLPDDLFPPVVRARLEQITELHSAEVLDDFGTAHAASVLADTEVLLTGWGCPRIDGSVLDRSPGLRAIVHAAGTVKPFLAPEAFSRGVLVSSAAAANALPVAQFTLAAIIMGAKRVFPISRSCADRRTGRIEADLARPLWLGNAGLTVGVVGASRTGRRVIELLHQVLEAEVLLYDPYVGAAEAAALGATPMDLDPLMAASDVVTVHAPDTAETRHLLDARRLSLMRPGALLVNTARGRLVDTEALTRHLVAGRLDAVLDVTDPEPLPAGHPLWELENVLLTPHLAGAQGNEVARLGASAVEEIARYAAGLPLRHPVLADDMGHIA